MSTGSVRSRAGPRRTRWVRAARAGAALAAVLAGLAIAGVPGCGSGHRADAERGVVLARLGGVPPLDADDAPPVRALKIGTHTRQALRVTGRARFEVRIPETADGLAFSTATGRDGGAVEFRVVARAPAGERTLFDRREAGPDPRWQDHALALPADVEALHFEATTAPEATGFWGSIRVTGPEPASRARRPNVVLIVMDTLRAGALGAYGGPPHVSPAIDLFFAEGFRFARAFAPYGNTLVSHASLFSALQPIHHGVYPGRPVGPLESSLVARLGAAGYQTVAFTEGAFVSANFGFAVGFDAYDDGLLGLTAQMRGGAHATFDHAADWIERHGDTARFFAFVHTYEVHAPYLPRDEAAQRVADARTPGDVSVPDADTQAELALRQNDGRTTLSPATLARLEALYLGEVSYLDRVFGTFLARLDAAGRAGDTLVVVTADHGELFGEDGKVGHSESLHEHGLQVPLGFRWPGVVRPGSSDVPVPLVDVLPTVLDLAGVQPPAGLDGHSLARILRGDAEPEVRPVFSEQRSARGECRKLSLPENCRLDRTAMRMRHFKLVRSQQPPYERLYDLEADPDESTDVSEQHPDTLRRYRARLDAYLASARDTDAGPEEPAGEPAVDAETLERLRALGYL